MANVLPPLADVPASVADPALRNMLQSLVIQIRALSGQSGKQGQKAVTFDDLVTAGLVTARPGFHSGSAGAGGYAPVVATQTQSGGSTSTPTPPLDAFTRAQSMALILLEI